MLSLGLLASIYSCREPLVDDPVIYGNNELESTFHKTRSVDEIKELALSFYGIMGKENGLNASSVVPDKSQLSLDVITLDQIFGNKDSKLDAVVSIDNVDNPKQKSSNDTLLYYAGLPGNGGMLLSGNEDSTPLLAILDDENFSFKEVLSDTENNEGVLSFLLTAAEYNRNPEAFADTINADETTENSPEAFFRIRWNFWKKRRNDPPQPVYLVDQVSPKVKVEWGQSGGVYNRYTPNHYPAGCVAVAMAQAITVTRNWKSFKGIDLDYDNLIKFRNDSYAYTYPKQADKVARLMERIGYHVGMNYGKYGSGADMNFAVGRMFRDYPDIAMNVSKDKRNIKNTLKYYDNGIVIVTSRTRTHNRGSGHAYVADGYLQYSNGSDLIHVNMGWGTQSETNEKYKRSYNGYYLSNLMSPHWIGQTPQEQLNLKHSWNFYCIYK